MSSGESAGFPAGEVSWGKETLYMAFLLGERGREDAQAVEVGEEAATELHEGRVQVEQYRHLVKRLQAIAGLLECLLQQLAEVGGGGLVSGGGKTYGETQVVGKDARVEGGREVGVPELEERVLLLFGERVGGSERLLLETRGEEARIGTISNT